MAISMEDLLHRIETLEQTHTQRIDGLQIHHELQIQRIEEIHDSDLNSLRSQLLQRIEEKDDQVSEIDR